jgi:hypothetical protein
MTVREPDDLPEGACRVCRLTPHQDWGCIALQWFAKRSGTKHPGRCWNGSYPDDDEAHKLEEDREPEKQRQAEERRQMQMQMPL